MGVRGYSKTWRNNSPRKNMGYWKTLGMVPFMISFTLERIQLFHPQNISLELPDLRDLHMRQWVDLMSRHAGPSSMNFMHAFFWWLCMYLIMVEDYPYARMDYCEYLEIVLPEGEKWSTIGKTKSFWLFFFLYFHISNTNYWLLHVEIGPIRPLGLSYL